MFFQVAQNIACGRPVVVIPDQPSTSCQQSNKTMKLSKCPCIFHCTLTFEDMEKPLNLSLDVLQCYLQQDVIKLCSKKILSHLRIPSFLLRKYIIFTIPKRNNTYEKTLTDTIFFSNLYLSIFFLETYVI